MASRRRHVLSDLTYEPARAAVRGWLGEPGQGRLIVDSASPLLVWEPRRFLPYYAFPDGDVDLAAIRPSKSPGPQVHGDGVTYFDLTVGATRRQQAGWSWPDPQLNHAIVVDWEALDQWFEEDDEIFGHPRDPYHRLDVLPTSRHVKVLLDDNVLAESRRTILMPETLLPARFYFDIADVRTDILTSSDLETVCPYKGFARYWTVHTARGAATREVAWSYLDPSGGLASVAGRIAFLDEVVDIYVDGVRRPRPHTQWSEGIRANTRGGGSGHRQAAHNGADESVVAQW
ncbi:MAG TPA: DUF427 domain-containing protein [Acidimicrobiales bacterium]|nr:DUF427 domain-containing protein [Acidimicrobiales bacterium]